MKQVLTHHDNLGQGNGDMIFFVILQGIEESWVERGHALGGFEAVCAHIGRLRGRALEVE